MQGKSNTLILFLLNNFETDYRVKFQSQISQANEKGISLISISYEDLLAALETVCQTDYLKGLLDDLQYFIDSKGLLLHWKYLLDVFNCVGSLHEIEAGGYLCTDMGRAYSHK